MSKLFFLFLIASVGVSAQDLKLEKVLQGAEKKINPVRPMQKSY